MRKTGSTTNNNKNLNCKWEILDDKYRLFLNKNASTILYIQRSDFSTLDFLDHELYSVMLKCPNAIY